MKEIVIDTNFQTPPEVCDYMASLVPTNADAILEPTPGTGNLVNALIKKGFTVISPPDYFVTRNIILKMNWDSIVMNPPFSTKSAFLDNAPEEFKTEKGMKFGYKLLQECMSISDNVIALMPWFTLSDSDVRLRFLHDFGIKSLTALPRKTFQYARIQTVVIELQKGWNKPTEFKVFERLKSNA
ncbi:DNA methyltransferase family protein [Aequorivita echinoideorum]|uniref:Methyltransferase small domain-containing protein n=1 Tax=Aequorivita echinoideorum TaxID=1549647 RepID=A0ABS5S5H7_9FLAO|nr:hypothetical protein [Aequorivita echinoideorum]MBT0607617.1 hypothetical protein [Aequorivita echinoideorum]